MKVSVVLPTHNRGKLISKALESVIYQSYENLEIIVVSDGSTDQTNSIMEGYEEEDPRIKFISYHPAHGANHARNIGINNACGEYIAFLDDDDEWLKDKIKLQLEEFNKNPKIGLVYTGAKIEYTDSNITYNSLPAKTGDLSNDILFSNIIGSTSSVMVRKDILNKTGLFDERLKALQDYDLWIRVCNEVEIGAVNSPLIKYYNSNSTTQISDDIKKYEEAMQYISEKYKDYYATPQKKMKQKQSHYMRLAKIGLRNNKKTARKYLRMHFKNKPSIKTVGLYVLTYVDDKTILKLRALKKD